jgi:hypothetical protein
LKVSGVICLQFLARQRERTNTLFLDKQGYGDVCPESGSQQRIVPGKAMCQIRRGKVWSQECTLVMARPTERRLVYADPLSGLEVCERLAQHSEQHDLTPIVQKSQTKPVVAQHLQKLVGKGGIDLIRVQCRVKHARNVVYGRQLGRTLLTGLQSFFDVALRVVRWVFHTRYLLAIWDNFPVCNVFIIPKGLHLVNEEREKGQIRP